MNLAGRTNILASLCCLANSAISFCQHKAALMLVQSHSNSVPAGIVVNLVVAARNGKIMLLLVPGGLIKIVVPVEVSVIVVFSVRTHFIPGSFGIFGLIVTLVVTKKFHIQLKIDFSNQYLEKIKGEV
jgi:hypothetical protein